MISVPFICNLTTIIIVGAILYITYFNRNTRAAKTDLPDLVTSLGVLGTFIGIVLGLIDFDPRNIKDSVPSLLQGLKTAFITSIAGMGAAYYLKGGLAYFRKPSADNEVDPDEKANENALELLQEISRSSKAMAAAIGGGKDTDISQQILSLKNSIAGDGETSVNTQLTKLRTEMRDKQDELVKEFRQFAQLMAENNSKAFIQALEQVIRDFNVKITEQFGENFKHLNTAVGQLLTWQDNYKVQVEKMVGQLDQNTQAIQKVREAFDSIVERSTVYVTTAERLEETLGRLKIAEDVVSQTLKDLNEISIQSKELLPQLEKRFKTMSGDIAKTLQASVDTTTSALKEHNDVVSKEFVGFAQAAKKLEDNIDATMERTSSHITRLLEENGKTISKSVEKLDATLEEELKKSITSLGRQLASLSEKFVSDYSPLTERLQHLVETSKRIGGGQ